VRVCVCVCVCVCLCVCLCVRVCARERVCEHSVKSAVCSTDIVHYVARGVFENVDELLRMFIRFQECR